VASQRQLTEVARGNSGFLATLSTSLAPVKIDVHCATHALQYVDLMGHA